jgi:competence protein ComEC
MKNRKIIPRCLFAIAAAAVAAFPARAADLKVTLVNVGVGDAILIQTPNGKNILIDGGYEDPGTSILIPYLKARGVTRLHHMVATHAHTDHTGGLKAILADPAFTVDQVIYKQANTTNPSQLGSTGSRPVLVLPTVTAPPSVELDWDEDLTVEVLAARDIPSAPNDSSIVIKLTYGEVSFLFTGDLEVPFVDDLVNAFPSEFPVTFVKVPHHGSNTSDSALFVARTSPKLALISCAKDQNDNPDDETLDLYAGRGIPVLRTDRNGHIVVATNGVSYSVSTSLFSADVRSVSAEPSVRVYPNPAPANTSPAKATFVYEIGGLADEVRVAVYTLAGELVRAWESAPNAAGSNYLEWDLKNGEGEDVVSGLYFVQVEARAGGGTQAGRTKMAVLR